MLMPYQAKIILLPEPFLPCALHLPLQLDDVLAQNETNIEEAHQYPRSDGHEMLVPPCIAYRMAQYLLGLSTRCTPLRPSSSPARTRRCCARLRGRPHVHGNKE